MKNELQIKLLLLYTLLCCLTSCGQNQKDLKSEMEIEDVEVYDSQETESGDIDYFPLLRLKTNIEILDSVENAFRTNNSAKLVAIIHPAISKDSIVSIVKELENLSEGKSWTVKEHYESTNENNFSIKQPHQENILVLNYKSNNINSMTTLKYTYSLQKSTFLINSLKIDGIGDKKSVENYEERYLFVNKTIPNILLEFQKIENNPDKDENLDSLINWEKRIFKTYKEMEAYDFDFISKSGIDNSLSYQYMINSLKLIFKTNYKDALKLSKKAFEYDSTAKYTASTYAVALLVNKRYDQFNSTFKNILNKKYNSDNSVHEEIIIKIDAFEKRGLSLNYAEIREQFK